MTILDNDALEFAKQHLVRFEDSDFFPRLSEFSALWQEWDFILQELTQSNIKRLNINAASTLPVAKGRHTYRVVHQLDAVTALVYAALGKQTANIIQDNRSDRGYSYRYEPNNGAFFSGGSGYEEYREETRALAEEYDFVATADITDFYNQIYSHRIQSAIGACDLNQDNFASDVEAVIHSINSGASKGIPVGPNASGILAEAIMIDVDQLLDKEGIIHTRYVDDIRIFSNDEMLVSKTLEELSLYLYSNHRLHLNSEKTGIYSQVDFLQSAFRDHIDDELEAAMAQIGLTAIYEHEDEPDLDFTFPDEDVLSGVAGLISERNDQHGWVDNNLLKAFLRRSRQANSDIYIETAVNEFECFVPVFHELAKSMENSLERGNHEQILPLINVILDSKFINRSAIKLWLGWVCASSSELLSHPRILGHVNMQSIKIQARAAVSRRNISWIRDKARDRLQQHSSPDRPALILATEILGRDERRAILRQVDERHASLTDVACARYARSL